MEFKAEEKFHNALGYMCERYPGFQTKDLKHIMSILNTSMLDGLFERREYKRKLQYVGESNEHFTHGQIYESLTFNGATYEIIDDTMALNIIGRTHFDRIG
ncbi:hypothetical protein Sulku_1726 [Sulfuricurvum kujiense DSM 16994]|uniref:Uncharacterized protein n=1 Tax=Sulfuricurvum kujiense (strain ATCC BAA-921 / DSM 16994 / JCM 11577 / YK-1) TaxID=709032 RepID=E4U0Y5_SULKY|nr:hypothetical protein [Sulfuricurvum kujiense]ADR34387.1 hypothetical protein Sulku_1726 [Sulfuricurvum kujiense DSM 16994]